MNGVRRDPERMETRRLLGRVSFPGARVLEIGGGDGRLTRRIAGAAREVVSVDPNAEAIARAQRLLPVHLKRKIRFEVASGDRLHFADKSFDIAVLSWSL
jgi:ubiquinone/menaquinone biosynthesis C-methylase UbiE